MVGVMACSYLVLFIFLCSQRGIYVFSQPERNFCRGVDNVHLTWKCAHEVFTCMHHTGDLYIIQGTYTSYRGPIHHTGDLYIIQGTYTSYRGPIHHTPPTPILHHPLPPTGLHSWSRDHMCSQQCIASHGTMGTPTCS